MKAGKGNLGGYTLVEVIIASVIFAMVIAGGIAGVRMGFQMVENSRHYTRASQILQSEVESLRSLSWQEIRQLPRTAEVNITPQFGAAAYDAYKVERRVFTESSALRRIEVTVQYTTRGGREMSLKYLTFFAEGGVNDYYYRTI